MSAEPVEDGESALELRKQFKKMVIEGGSLKGAHYTDVSNADLVKAARSYRGDVRFQQFAKRMIAAKTLAIGSSEPSRYHHTSVAAVPGITTRFLYGGKAFACWLFTKMKGRVCISLFCFIIIGVLLSRPKLYYVLNKLMVAGIKKLIRHGVGTIAMVFDAVLEEIADQLDSTPLATPPENREVPIAYPTNSPYIVMPSNSITELTVHLLCIIIGTILSPLLGQRWPRAQMPPRDSRP